MDEHAVVVARRSKILHSACQALSKSFFAWHRTPRIEFVRESADDFGGPQREFFRLLMIEEGELDRFDFQDLPDSEVHFKMQQIHQCTSVSDLISLKANLGDWIADCGVHWIYTAGLSDMLRIYSLVIKHFIYHRPASMISQFKAGVNSSSRKEHLL
ncbi:hypothetical protein KOW79_018808 [Hemibagrus wyckioides]|uniref:HECT domain-containing protein n=1 Tax=Hemibagrus wyckioides TaxID=337641 RepID=A0A9D3NAG0_9TELE|nr:hypothetical protein KOW79_018808 [Hemibagrus wyckioides]